MAGQHLDLSNLSKSLNEILVLTALADGTRHGYQLAQDVEERSSGLFRFKHGTLYPILHKLERQQLIQGRWSDEGRRRRRRAYELTAAGRTYAAALGAEWHQLLSTLFEMIGRES
jgi:DNA-binding PadR family transcriptional regulator